MGDVKPLIEVACLTCDSCGFEIYQAGVLTEFTFAVKKLKTILIRKFWAKLSIPSANVRLAYAEAHQTPRVTSPSL